MAKDKYLHPRAGYQFQGPLDGDLAEQVCGNSPFNWTADSRPEHPRWRITGEEDVLYNLIHEEAFTGEQPIDDSNRTTDGTRSIKKDKKPIAGKDF